MIFSADFFLKDGIFFLESTERELHNPKIRAGKKREKGGIHPHRHTFLFVCTMMNRKRTRGEERIIKEGRSYCVPFGYVNQGIRKRIRTDDSTRPTQRTYNIRPPFGGFPRLIITSGLSSDGTLRKVCFRSRHLWHGTHPLALREVVRARKQVQSAHVMIDPDVHNLHLLYDAKSQETVHETYHARPANLFVRKAWIYEVVWAVAYFHDRGQPFGNVFTLDILANGAFTREARSFINKNDSDRACPSMLCLFANRVMRMGNAFSDLHKIRSYSSPEIFLGKQKHHPGMDMWVIACLLHELFLSPYSGTDQQCHICSSALPLFGPHDQKNPSITLRCGHRFHIQCLHQHVENQCTAFCPKCTMRIPDDWKTCPHDPIPAGSPLFCLKDPLTCSFGHMLEIFKCIGTPTPKNWPGVQRLPHYSSHMPQWKGDASRLDRVIFPQLTPLLQKLLSHDPSTRLSAKKVLQDDFFRDVRGRFKCTPVGPEHILRPLLLQQKNQYVAHKTHSFTLPEKNAQMRSCVVDWLIGISIKVFNCMDDTVFLAVMLMDRFILLRHQGTIPDNVNLLAAVCLSISSKTIDTVCVTLRDAHNVFPANSVAIEDVEKMEVQVLETLDFQLNLVHPLHFLRVFLAELRASHQTRCLAFRLAHLFLIHKTSYLALPSDIAMSVAILADTGRANSKPPPQLARVLNIVGLYSSRGRQCLHEIHMLWKNSNISTVHSCLRTRYSSMASVGPHDVQRSKYVASCGSRHDPVQALPAELMKHVFTFLARRELCSASSVSHKWKTCCEHIMRCDRGLWDFSCHKETINALALNRFAPKLKRVREVNLSGCALDFRSLHALFGNCVNLRRIDLSHTRRDTRSTARSRSAWRSEWKNVPSSLMDIDLQSSTLFEKESDIVKLITGNGSRRRIERLHLGRNRVVGSRTIIAILESGACETLKEIHLSYCAGIDDKSIQLLANACNTSLEKVYLDMCPNVTTKSIRYLSQKCTKLRVLSLCSTRMNDQSLRYIGNHCVKLQNLRISFCRLCSNNGLQYLLQSNIMKHIKSLDLSLIPHIETNTIRLVAEHCGEIEHLNVRGCFRVEDTTIYAIGKHCTKLKHLNIVRCVNVSNRAKFIFRHGYPTVRLLC